MQFANRLQAGRLLAQQLGAYRGRNPLILAIPRGGIPVGQMVAEALVGELDVVLVHKLASPDNPECAIGSMTEDGQIELGPHAVEPRVSRGELQQEIQTQAENLRRRRFLYTPVKEPADPAHRIVIIVDDGLATGLSMMAALKAIRARKPARLVAAVPVSPLDTLARVQELADETVCLLAPPFFTAVGLFYDDFSTVTDEEVIERLRDPKRKRLDPVRQGGLS